MAAPNSATALRAKRPENLNFGLPGGHFGTLGLRLGDLGLPRGPHRLPNEKKRGFWDFLPPFGYPCWCIFA